MCGNVLAKLSLSDSLVDSSSKNSCSSCSYDASNSESQKKAQDTNINESVSNRNDGAFELGMNLYNLYCKYQFFS